MKEENDKGFTPLEVEDYVPAVVKRLLMRILKDSRQQVILFGFSSNFKWLSRLLTERGYELILCDWRPEFIGYDCGGRNVVSIDDASDDPESLIVICLEEIAPLKAAISYLIHNRKRNIPTIYDRTLENNPYREEEPYRSIRWKAIKRAQSMIFDHQLFDLIQFVDQTRNVDGDIVEYGSLYGGSGAIITEAANHFCSKNIWLFDSFSGIPKSSYGLDYCWEGAFSDNSFAEVKNAFADLDNVTVVNGNIMDTYNCIPGKISFGYIASDTLESGEILLEYIWEKLSPGGIVAICDYGSYPNALPLTVIVDEFFQNKQNDAFLFHPARLGFFAVKRK